MERLINKLLRDALTNVYDEMRVRMTAKKDEVKWPEDESVQSWLPKQNLP